MDWALGEGPQKVVKDFFDRQATMSMYEFGSFQLDVERLLLLHDGEPVALGPKVVETLLALVEHPGEVLTKAALMDRIWPEGFVEEANLAQNVHVLRKTFRHHGSAGWIDTIPHRGYRFTAPVRRRENARPSRIKPDVPRRIAAAFAGITLVAATLALVASYGFGRPSAAPALSEKGARFLLIGQYYWNLRTRDGVRKSLTYFARAIDADPRNARGYAALADANAMMGDYCYGTHAPSVYFARAEKYARTALALNPDSAEAHAALGFLALDRQDVYLATTELQRAIALDPAYGPAREWYGIALVRQGRLSEGFAHLKAAANLDPLSVATIAWLGSTAYRERRFSDAVAYAQEALELSPHRADVLSTMGQAYEAQGDLNRAIDAFKRYGAVSQYYRPRAAVLLAHALALAHRTAEARTQLDYARAHARQMHGHGALTFA